VGLDFLPWSRVKSLDLPSILYILYCANQALSTTFASSSIVPPITIEDYEFTGVGGPEGTQWSGEVASFPQSVEFEKEELDTTPERDPPS
ncbi:hypothetical protein Tco_0500684, partial [Tanacetum coccineum]